MTLEKLYTSTEVAEHLGVTVPTVREWIKDGHLKAHRFGRQYMIREGDLRAFVNAKYGVEEEENA